MVNYFIGERQFKFNAQEKRVCNANKKYSVCIPIYLMLLVREWRLYLITHYALIFMAFKSYPVTRTTNSFPTTARAGNT